QSRRTGMPASACPLANTSLRAKSRLSSKAPGAVSPADCHRAALVAATPATRPGPSLLAMSRAPYHAHGPPDQGDAVGGEPIAGQQRQEVRRDQGTGVDAGSPCVPVEVPASIVAAGTS